MNTLGHCDGKKSSLHAYNFTSKTLSTGQKEQKNPHWAGPPKNSCFACSKHSSKADLGSSYVKPGLSQINWLGLWSASMSDFTS